MRRRTKKRSGYDKWSWVKSNYNKPFFLPTSLRHVSHHLSFSLAFSLASSEPISFSQCSPFSGQDWYPWKYLIVLIYDPPPHPYNVIHYDLNLLLKRRYVNMGPSLSPCPPLSGWTGGVAATVDYCSMDTHKDTVTWGISGAQITPSVCHSLRV